MKRYTNAKAFRAALEARLNRRAQDQKLDIMRLRRFVAFERMLARLYDEEDPPWIVKGGYTFELRLDERARVTRDIDLTIPIPRAIAPGDVNQAHAIHERLRDSIERDLGDWFVFRVGETMKELDGPPYGGARIPVEARLDERPFITYHMDIGLGDPVVAPPEWLLGHDLLGFAEIAPTRIAVLSREQQFAEKIHAYTLPRGERPNTRVKDLVDLVLLLGIGLPERDHVLRALAATFERRVTHELPVTLPPPAGAWRAPYAALAAECKLPIASADGAFRVIADYWATLGIAG